MLRHGAALCRPLALALAPRQVRFTSSQLRMGIFIDLDNVAPETHGRDDARALVGPLKEFAWAAADGSPETYIVGFANNATQTWASEEERDRRDAVHGEQEWTQWDGHTAQTGLDANGVLRCGVCGARMVVKTKKQRAAGMTPELLLEKHMQMLHDREQRKRLNRRKKMSRKDLEKTRKFRTAQARSE